MSAQRPLTAEGPGWHPPGRHGSAGPCGAAKGGRGPRTAAKRVGRSLPATLVVGTRPAAGRLVAGRTRAAKAAMRRVRGARGGWVVGPWRRVPSAPPRGVAPLLSGKGRTGAPPSWPAGSPAAALSPADGAVAGRALAVLELPLLAPAARPGGCHQEADAPGLDGADDGCAAAGGLEGDAVGGLKRPVLDLPSVCIGSMEPRVAVLAARRARLEGLGGRRELLMGLHKS
jgi:hypothetical protein